MSAHGRKDMITHTERRWGPPQSTPPDGTGVKYTAGPGGFGAVLPQGQDRRGCRDVDRAR